jgi:CheY-like chemotaxis protein
MYVRWRTDVRGSRRYRRRMLQAIQSPGFSRSQTQRDPRGSRNDAPVQSETRILIIDNDRQTGRSLALMLEATGYDEIRTVRSAARAITVAEEFRPALVFLDIEMPEPGGYDLATQLQRNSKLRAMRLIALTTDVEHATREAARVAGFERFLVKPVTQVELDKILRRPVTPAA